MDNPFGITLYDKNLGRTGWVNDPAELTVTPRHNAIGTTTLTVASDHRKLPQLMAPGARMVVTYYGEHLTSGYITSRGGSGPKKAGLFTFGVQDDLWLVWRLLGWPAPGAAINAQGTKKDTRTGPAETVAKAFISAQLAHNSVDPIQVAPTQGRGATITASSRMSNLADVLMGAVDKAGIGLSARQVGNKIVLDAYTPRVYPHTLSEDAGTITNWSWSDNDPAMTRAIVGGPNEATSREFRQVPAAGAANAVEDTLGYTIEGFVDARSAENYADMDEAGVAALGENGPKVGFSIELSETKVFRYGGAGGVHVGDRVPVDIGGQTLTDVLREAPITWTVGEGLTARPAVGDHSDDPDTTLVTFLNKVRRSIRDMATR